MKSKLFLPFLLIWFVGFSQENYTKRPKLVVGIVVDQMRQDYIFRYWDKFGENGIKRLLRNGYFAKNTQYNYVPTFTGPGHSSIYTGTTPAVHGIAANDWYERETKKSVYCASDETVNSVGSSSKAGKMSPRNLKSNTIGDELKLYFNQKSKVYGIAIKDRSAILPAGHSADAAFWFDGSTGDFITSDYYLKSLPNWLKEFNSKKLPKTYLEKGWNTLLAIENYSESIADENPFEKAPNKKEKPVFPYDFKQQIASGNYEIIRATPQGNSLTKDLAIACLKGENLGKDQITDLLAISFSSTDYVGHAYGPRSVEVEDTYLRLDKDLEELLNVLDNEVGKNEYLCFLTADHGACDVPNHLMSVKIPAGYANAKAIESELKAALRNRYGDSLVESYDNQQVYLNNKVIEDKKLNKTEIENFCAEHLLKRKEVQEVFTGTQLRSSNYTEGFGRLIQKGYFQKRSGDVMVNYLPGWMENGPTGTTHGAPYSYDTQVPLIFFGWGIKKGINYEPVEITDIVPTLSQLLNIPYTNGCTGKVIDELFED